MTIIGFKAGASLVAQYHSAIDKVVAAAPHGDDKFVHVQAGMLIWCAAALLARRRLSSIIPLVAVIAIELVNELMDRFYAGSWNWPDTRGDMLSTWLWPVVLFVFLRWQERLLLRPRMLGASQTLPTWDSSAQEDAEP